MDGLCCKIKLLCCMVHGWVSWIEGVFGDLVA